MNYEEIVTISSKEKIASLLKTEHDLRSAVESELTEVKNRFAAIERRLKESERMVDWYKNQLFGKKSEKSIGKEE